MKKSHIKLLTHAFNLQECDEEQKIHIGNVITYEQPAKRHAQQISESPK